LLLALLPLTDSEKNKIKITAGIGNPESDKGFEVWLCSLVAASLIAALVRGGNVVGYELRVKGGGQAEIQRVYGEAGGQGHKATDGLLIGTATGRGFIHHPHWLPTHLLRLLLRSSSAGASAKSIGRRPGPYGCHINLQCRGIAEGHQLLAAREW